MTKEELLQKLSEIEWDDFECKAALDKHKKESENIIYNDKEELDS